MKKMRILLCSPYDLESQNENGVNKINYNVLHNLAGLCDIKVLQPSSRFSTTLTSLGVAIESLDFKVRSASKVTFLSSTFSLFSHSEYIFKPYSKKLAEYINTNHIDFDCIHLSSYLLSSALPLLSESALEKIKFFPIDSKILVEQTRVKQGSFLLKPYREFLCLKAKLLTKYIYAKAEWICFVSKVDVDVSLRYLQNSNVHYIPNGVEIVDVEINTRKTPWVHGLTLCFHGDLTFGPNVVAVNNILNLIPCLEERLEFPFKVKLIGKGSEGFSDFSENIVGLGFVEDLYRELNDCDLYLSLIETGAGIKNKLLDAMAVGLPIIATQESVSGIEYAVKRHNYMPLLTVRPQDVVDAINELGANIELLHTLSKNSINTVRENYDWLKLSKSYLKFYRGDNLDG